MLEHLHLVPCDQQGGNNQQMFDFSYLWVSNSPAGTVSKIMTLKAANSCEYGRFQGVA